MECIATCHLSQSQSLLVHVYKPEFHLGAPQLELTCNTSSSLLAVLLRRLRSLGDITLMTTVINSNSSNYQLSLLSLLMSTATSRSVSQADIIQISEPVQALLNNPPRAQQPGLVALVEWIVKLGFALVGMIANLAKQLADQADKAFEVARRASAQFPAMSTATTTGHGTASSGRATAGHGTTTSQRGTAPSPKRCNRCHARGHTVDDCKTTNPSAMRKRVARNNRIAKEARRSPTMPTPSVPPPFPWLPHHYPPPYPSAAPTYQMASLASDAAELRRRSVQSARDKRRNRRPQTSS